MSLKFEVKASLFHCFDALEAELGPALARLEEAEIFQSVEWFRLIAETLRDEIDELLLLVAHSRGSDELTLLPLMRLKEQGTYQARPTLSGLANYYSVLFGPATTASDARTRAAHLDAAFRCLRRKVDFAVLDLQPLAAEAEHFADLRAALRRAGLWPGEYFRFGNWYLPIVWPDYSGYLEDRPHDAKGPLLRAEKRLQRPEMKCTIEVYRGHEDDFDEAVRIFDRVYRNSWRQPEPYPNFAESLCHLAATCGWLRLGVLKLAGEPAAVQLWLTRKGKANIYKIAYDAAFSKLSPGNVLTGAMIRHAIEQDKVMEIDYLTGDEAYKQKWMSRRRERLGLVAFNPWKPAGLKAAVRHFGGAWVRSLQRKRSSPAAPAAGADTSTAPGSKD